MEQAAERSPSVHSPLADFWRRFLRHRAGYYSLMVLIAIALVSFSASLGVGGNPSALSEQTLAAPSLQHVLGTDHLGRDILARILHGSRISLGVGVWSGLLCALLGVLVGGLAGYLGGKADRLLMGVTDVVLVLPTFYVVLICSALFGASMPLVILLIALTSWPQVARMVRIQFLLVRQYDFVQAARALGATHRRIMLRHVLPNALPPILAATTLRASGAILTEASLGFLGLGDSNELSLGQLLIKSISYMRLGWWTTVFPGLAIFILVLAFNLLGDGLNDAWNPRTRKG